MADTTIRMINANIDDDGFMDAISAYVTMIQMQMYDMAQSAEVAADNAVEEFESLVRRLDLLGATDMLGDFLKLDLTAAEGC